jgi:hypothetical protein
MKPDRQQNGATGYVDAVRYQVAKSAALASLNGKGV